MSEVRFCPEIVIPDFLSSSLLSFNEVSVFLTTPPERTKVTTVPSEKTGGFQTMYFPTELYHCERVRLVFENIGLPLLPEHGRGSTVSVNFLSFCSDGSHLSSNIHPVLPLLNLSRLPLLIRYTRVSVAVALDNLGIPCCR